MPTPGHILCGAAKEKGQTKTTTVHQQLRWHRVLCLSLDFNCSSSCSISHRFPCALPCAACCSPAAPCLLSFQAFSYWSGFFHHHKLVGYFIAVSSSSPIHSSLFSSSEVLYEFLVSRMPHGLAPTPIKFPSRTKMLPCNIKTSGCQ